MTTSAQKEVEKKAFRAGYECSCINTLAVPSSPDDLDLYKLKVNYLVRDIYIFLMNHNQTKEDIFGEYMDQISDRRFDTDTPASFYQLLPDVVGNAVTRGFASAPEIAHAYFLSRICHFFLFGIRLDLTKSTSVIGSSFDHLLSLHEKYGCWPYPLEMREALYTIYECFAANIWPSNMLIRHLYACLAEFHKIEVDDLLTTVGSDLRALDAFYPRVFPTRGQRWAPGSHCVR